MPTSFPFQLSRGIHTSTLISESEVGVRVACTRQKAGVFLKTAIPPGPPIMKPPAGGLNWPASTMDAEVILPSFNLRDVRLPHVSAARAGIADRARAIIAEKMICLNLFTISGSFYFLGAAHSKFSASSIFPLPLYFAVSG